MTKKKSIVYCVIVASVVLLFTACASTPAGSHAPIITPEGSVAGLNELIVAVRDVSDYLNDNIPHGNMIVFVNVQSTSEALSDFIIDDLTANAVNDRIFTVVDRHQLDVIRAEQDLQLSGEVDDETALSIGRFLGAQTIVSGRVNSLGGHFRLIIRALDVQTAQVQGQYNRIIGTERVISALIGGGGHVVMQAPVRHTPAAHVQQVVPRAGADDGGIVPVQWRGIWGDGRQHGTIEIHANGTISWVGIPHWSVPTGARAGVTIVNGGSAVGSGFTAHWVYLVINGVNHGIIVQFSPAVNGHQQLLGLGRGGVNELINMASAAGVTFFPHPNVSRIPGFPVRANEWAWRGR